MRLTWTVAHYCNKTLYEGGVTEEETFGDFPGKRTPSKDL